MNFGKAYFLVNLLQIRAYNALRLCSPRRCENPRSTAHHSLLPMTNRDAGVLPGDVACDAEKSLTQKRQSKDKKNDSEKRDSVQHQFTYLFAPHKKGRRT